MKDLIEGNERFNWFWISSFHLISFVFPINEDWTTSRWSLAYKWLCTPAKFRQESENRIFIKWRQPAHVQNERFNWRNERFNWFWISSFHLISFVFLIDKDWTTSWWSPAYNGYRPPCRISPRIINLYFNVWRQPEHVQNERFNSRNERFNCFWISRFHLISFVFQMLPNDRILRFRWAGGCHE